MATGDNETALQFQFLCRYFGTLVDKLDLKTSAARIRQLNSSELGFLLYELLPTVFVVQLVSVFDSALRDYLKAEGIAEPARCELSDRIRILSQNGRLLNPDKLDRIRRTRNRCVHKPFACCDMREAADIVVHLYKELAHICVVPPRIALSDAELSQRLAGLTRTVDADDRASESSSIKASLARLRKKRDAPRVRRVPSKDLQPTAAGKVVIRRG